LEKRKDTAPEGELLALLSSQVAYAPIIAVVSAGIITYMARQQAPELAWLWGLWMATVVSMQLARVIIVRNSPSNSAIDPRTRLQSISLLNMGNTALFSLSLVFFPLFTSFQAAVQSMLFMGMGVASIAPALGFMPFVLAHLLLGLMPLFAMWAWSGLYGPGGATALLVSLAGLAYTATLYNISHRIYRELRQSFENQLELENALTRAETAGNAKTRFLAAASHDLRQPIHALSLFSATLGMRNLDPRTTQIAESIDSAVKALAYQLDALLDISKLDAGIVTAHKSRFNLKDFLLRLRDEFATQAEDREIRLQLECPVNAIVNTDHALLERIIRNLLNNAINHNMNCTIQVAVDRSDGQWQLSVADTGSGIPKEEQSKIFEEFYQLENPERDRSKGLGLGLAIVQRLSRLLELDMQFESETGWGTRFKLHLLADIAEPGTYNGVYTRRTSLDGLSVLVVDDESAVRDGMKTLLEVLGCHVQIAGSTSAAISLATSHKPDLALVDLRLRDHDSGLNTIDRLRHLYPGLPAIIISGDTAPDRLQQAKKAGIPILSKPVLVEPLKNAMSKACHFQSGENVDTGIETEVIA
jgi:signal transduction histidine kinase/ActR/RegA family two-component response regulator